MSIRTKFFALAGVLLALFGLVVGVLALLQHDTADNLVDIVEHNLPLTRLLANVDVDTFEYELQVERLRRRSDWSPDELTAQRQRIAAVAERMQRDFAAIRQ